MNEPSIKRFTRAHPLEPRLPSEIKYFSNYNSCQNECFFLKQWMCIKHEFEFQFNE